MARLETLQPVITFLGITFGLSIILSMIVGVTGGGNSRLFNLALIAFFFPAIAVLIMTLRFKERIPDPGWNRFSLPWLLAALFVIPLAIHVVALPVTALLNNFKLPWLEWLTPAADGLYHTSAEINWGVLTTGGLIGRLFLNAITGLLIVAVLAFFEEIGWRAWMLPRLVDHFGLREGVFISSLIWALWHVPFVFGSIQHIEGVPPPIMLVLYPLGLLGAGCVLGWLWLRCGSIWIVCLGHGALNNWGQFAFKYMTDSTKTTGINENIVLLATVNLTLLVVGLVILFKGFNR